MGDWSLTLGVIALVTTFVPVIGDVVAAPVALLAIALGVVGVRRYDARRAARVAPAAAGALLGALAAVATVLVMIATNASH